MKKLFAALLAASLLGCNPSPNPKSNDEASAPAPIAERPPVPALSPEERKALIVKATAGLVEERDKMEGISFYSPKTVNYLSARLSAYLSVPDKTRPLLRVMPVYYGDDWVFFDRIKVMADDVVVYEREMRDGDVIRDNSGGSVWETADFVGRDADLAALKQIASSKGATIRFSGQEGRHDHELTKLELANLRQVLTAYEELSSKLGK